MLLKKSNYWLEVASSTDYFVVATSVHMAGKLNRVFKTYSEDADFKDSEVRFRLSKKQVVSVAAILGLKDLAILEHRAGLE